MGTTTKGFASFYTLPLLVAEPEVEIWSPSCAAYAERATSLD